MSTSDNNSEKKLTFNDEFKSAVLVLAKLVNSQQTSEKDKILLREKTDIYLKEVRSVLAKKNPKTPQAEQKNPTLENPESQPAASPAFNSDSTFTQPSEYKSVINKDETKAQEEALEEVSSKPDTSDADTKKLTELQQEQSSSPDNVEQVGLKSTAETDQAQSPESEQTTEIDTSVNTTNSAVDNQQLTQLQQEIEQLTARNKWLERALSQAQQNTGLKPGQAPSLNTTPSTTPRPPIMVHMSFKIPNAKVGEQYTAKIEALDSQASITIRNVKSGSEDTHSLAALGLSFDEGTQEIKGTPTYDGEQKIFFQWSKDGKTWQTGSCLFFINPDPKTLWKVIEPPKAGPYYKDNLDSKTVTAATHTLYAASRRGRSHEHAGTFRDDDFSIIDNPELGWSLMIVADGAGSAKSSREGSKIAVNTFADYLQREFASERGHALVTNIENWREGVKTAGTEVGKEFHYIFHAAAKDAVQAIESEADKQQAAIKDYSTTLLAAVTRQVGSETFVATFWMGDGAIAVYGPRQKVRVMGTPDGGEFAGQTRFLDKAALMDSEFSKRVNIGCYADYDAILLMTDGVSDPRFETDAGLVKPELWDNLWDELKPVVESDEVEKKLLEWLHFFEAGHHDDRTLAVLVPRIEQIEPNTTSIVPATADL